MPVTKRSARVPSRYADRTTTAHGRLMLTILAGQAEFERELIKTRTSEGREARRTGVSTLAENQSSLFINGTKRSRAVEPAKPPWRSHGSYNVAQFDDFLPSENDHGILGRALLNRSWRGF